MSKKYVHYGSTEFYPELVGPIRNQRMFTKPYGGFWGSPVDTDNGWKDWCESERFRKCREEESFVFSLKPEARVLYLREPEDLKGLPTQVENEMTTWTSLDFERLVEDGWDAVEVEIGPLWWQLYGWDCDSILIMNPEVVTW